MSENDTCTHVSGCELYPHLSKGGLLRIWQVNYCEGNYRSCERFVLSSRRERVSPTMLPNGKELAILARKAGP